MPRHTSVVTHRNQMAGPAGGILDVIHQDHQAVLGIFESLAKTSDRAGKSRSQQIDKLSRELAGHMKFEEKSLYPFVRDQVGDRQHALEAVEEHVVARAELKKLQNTAPGDEHWSVRLKVLRDLIEHHIREEEDVIFSEAGDALDEDRSRQMVEKFWKEKETARRAG